MTRAHDLRPADRGRASLARRDCIALIAPLLVGCARDAIDREALLDPASCASCHPEHYAEWAGSMHAYASDDPVFLALNRAGQRATGGGLGSFCVACHAPTALAEGATRDGTELASLPRYLRGVGCWSCHAVDGVTALHNGGLTRADDGVMRGGFRDPVSHPAHGSERSRLLDGDALESSDVCGACHDVVVGAGVAVEATYAEWAGSVFGPGGAAPVSCAACHMFGRDGPAAALPGLPVRRLHDHGFPAIDQALIPWPGQDVQAAGIARDLDAALTSRLCVVPGPGGVEVQVTLDNLQVGHAFPSGVTHARRAWVEVSAQTGGQTVMRSGHFEPGQPVSAAADPALWVLTDKFRGADGREVDHAWEAAAIESELLGPSVTTDPQDPRFYHARTRSYPVVGAPDRVDLAFHIEPIGLDLLDLLIASGDLAPSVRAAMPRRSVPSLARTWLRTDGLGVHTVTAVLALVLAIGLGACVRVRPHQRERLADPAMQAPVWPALERADEHTREIGEGTGGATDSAGGGCGCN